MRNSLYIKFCACKDSAKNRLSEAKTNLFVFVSVRFLLKSKTIHDFIDNEIFRACLFLLLRCRPVLPLLLAIFVYLCKIRLKMNIYALLRFYIS